jgi:rare lipoprotein A
MNRTLLVASVLAFSTTGALAQGPCTQGVRIVSAWYAEGKHTASGQRFNPQGLTAAHRTFPFGTRLIVINPQSGKSVTVTINDRGPFVKGIGLDLSLGAAKVIGLTGTGAVCMAKVGVAG